MALASIFQKRDLGRFIYSKYMYLHVRMLNSYWGKSTDYLLMPLCDADVRKNLLLNSFSYFYDI